MSPSRRHVAAFALALTVSGLVASVLFFAGPGTYADIARASGRESATFRGADAAAGALFRVDRATLIALHEDWLGYVTGRRSDPPAPFGGRLFTQAEYAHMADVRRVFIAAQAAAALAALLLAWLAVHSWRRGTLARLIRAGALAALIVVAVVGAFAALAFDAAFLLFHQVFFPQGNFLFGPDSNLLGLYPESYFYGVTLRIGAAFVAGALALAGVAHAVVRFAREGFARPSPPGPLGTE